MAYEQNPSVEFERFKNLSDEEIVAIYQNEKNHFASDYLIRKYKNFVRSKAKTYFLAGADREDIIQEGMIGLYKATRNFNDSHQVSFRAFAELCITRQIISAVKGATRQKHIPLNSYVSLNKPIYEDESERTLIDILETEHIADPEEMVISEERYSIIKDVMEAILSPLEWDVLRGYMDSKSYTEMAKETGRSVKSIDNALQRVKKKMEIYFDSVNYKAK